MGAQSGRGLGWRGSLRHLSRESRGSRGRLFFFVLCLSVGVAAVVSVKAFSASVEAGVRSQARELIAGDALVTARRSSADDLSQFWQDFIAARPGVEVAETRETLSVVSRQKDVVSGGLPGLPIPGLLGSSRTQLTEFKAVSEGYPFYGEAEVEPEGALRRLFDPDRSYVLVAPEVLERLDLEVGEVLLVGGTPFEIVGVIRSEPDRIGGSLSLAPRAMASLAAVRRTAVFTQITRSNYSAQLRVSDDADLGAVVDALEAELPEGQYRVETYREARPQLRAALQRVGAFLGLVALLSLLIGGVGVSQTVRAWLATRWDQIAILKSLGMRPREVFLLYSAQVLLLALVGSAVGALIGSFLQLLVPTFFGDMIPRDLVKPWQPWPVFQGMLLGVVVALSFSVPALLVVLRVPAARVLRRDSQPLRRQRKVQVFLGLALFLVVFLVASVQAIGMPFGPLVVGGAFALLVAVTVLALMLAAKILIAWVARLRPHKARKSAWGVVWRYGVASLARPGSGSLAGIVALGLGILVVLSMVLIEQALTERLQEDLPRDAPSMFLMGIQEHQWPGLEKILLEGGRQTPGGLNTPQDAEQSTDAVERVVRSVPVIITRVIDVDGTPIEELATQTEEAEGTPEESSRRWAVRRQLRVTPATQIPEGNTLEKGDWFQDDGVWEASLEREFAQSLGVDVGSTITLEVGAIKGDDGQELIPAQVRTFTVSNIREVLWESFSINFYVVVESGAFSEADTFRLATVRAASEEEQAIQDLAVAAYPNVTIIRVRQALDKIVEIFSKLAFGIRFLGLFTVVSGLVILAGSVAATAAQRGREAALLKSLGMKRGQVVLAFATEYALIGLVAALVAILGASLASWAAATFVLEIDWRFRPVPVLVSVLLGVTLAVVGGVAASTSAILRRPIEALRSDR